MLILSMNVHPTSDHEVDSKFMLEIQVYCAISSMNSSGKGQQQQKGNKRRLGKSVKEN